MRILSAADLDAADILAYLAQVNRGAATKMLEKLYQAMESLEQNPERGARVRDRMLSKYGFRFLQVEPYLVFYRVVAQEVHIHHIAHERTRPASIVMDILQP